MCIWKVSPEDRRCEFCTYRGGCERYEKPWTIEDARDFYFPIMAEVTHGAVNTYKNDKLSVWGRYVIIYKLFGDGFSSKEIGRLFCRNHATVFYAKAQVEAMLQYPNSYPTEIEIWNKFQEKLSQQKQ